MVGLGNALELPRSRGVGSRVGCSIFKNSGPDRGLYDIICHSEVVPVRGWGWLASSQQKEITSLLDRT